MDVAALDDRWVVVSWVEGGEILLQRVSRDGALGEALPVAAISEQRSSGFPRIAPAGDELLVVWTESGDPTRVRAIAVELEP